MIMSKKEPSYYGAFFWVAAISFVVPLFVAARGFYEVPVASKPTPRPDASGVDHALWDYLLKTYTDHGQVDYDGLSRDYLFPTYLRQLAAADPTRLSTAADNLALLCNAYNAMVIDGVITHKIDDSVMNYQLEGQEFFDIPEHIFAGRTVSLNHLEHEEIRKRFREPRIHVALVCAARSCPPLRAEAYVGRRLASQLEDQSRLFANRQQFVHLDVDSDSLQLSLLLQWYGDDWQDLGGYLPWLAGLVNDKSLKDALQRATRDEIKISWFDYDWTLNAQENSATGAAVHKKSGGFGSGSVPNE
jgi:hypothetical protein